MPLYAVVASLALALAWQLLRGDERVARARPDRVAARRVRALDRAHARLDDRRPQGRDLPRRLHPPVRRCSRSGFARLPWRGRWLTWLWAALVGTALAYAVVGGYQWVRRDVFWNPGVIVGNAYAPFFRVNSVFWDPSIYGRYLAVAILATLTGVLLGGVSRWKLVGSLRRGRRDLGRAVSLVLAVELRRAREPGSSSRRRSSGAAARSSGWWRSRVLVGLASLGFPSVRHDLVGHGRSGANEITSGRANLVSQGIRIARTIRSTASASAASRGRMPSEPGSKGADPKKAASHTTPVTVAAEEGLPGLALLVWLVLAALAATLLGLGRGFTSRVSLARRARPRSRSPCTASSTTRSSRTR